MDKTLRNLLKELCLDLQELWALEAFNDYYWGFVDSKHAKTTASSEATILPATQRPVRGHLGIEIRLSENSSKNLERRIESLVLRSNRLESYYSQAVQSRVNKVIETVKRLGSSIDEDLRLSYRLYGSIGYKTFSPASFSEMKKKENWDGSTVYFITIADLLAKELVANEFSLSERSKFQKWNVVRENISKELEMLRQEEDYHYEVLIFLNGPLVDCEEDILIANLSLQGKPIEISLGYAIDEILTPLVEYEKHPAIERVNTVIKYKVDIPVEAEEEDYLIQYHNASL